MRCRPRGLGTRLSTPSHWPAPPGMFEAGCLAATRRGAGCGWQRNEGVEVGIDSWGAFAQAGLQLGKVGLMLSLGSQLFSPAFGKGLSIESHGLPNFHSPPSLLLRLRFEMVLGSQ